MKLFSSWPASKPPLVKLTRLESVAKMEHGDTRVEHSVTTLEHSDTTVEYCDIAVEH